MGTEFFRCWLVEWNFFIWESNLNAEAKSQITIHRDMFYYISDCTIKTWRVCNLLPRFLGWFYNSFEAHKPLKLLKHTNSWWQSPLAFYRASSRNWHTKLSSIKNGCVRPFLYLWAQRNGKIPTDPKRRHSHERYARFTNKHAAGNQKGWGKQEMSAYSRNAPEVIYFYPRLIESIQTFSSFRTKHILPFNSAVHSNRWIRILILSSYHS